MFQDDPELKTTYIPAATKYQADPLRDGVLVPGLQAAITGLLAAICAGALAALLPLGVTVLTAAILAGSVVSLGSWLFYRGGWQAVFERITGANEVSQVQQPAMLPEPPAVPPEPVRIELIQDDGKYLAGDYIDLPVPVEKLKTLATGIINHRRQFALSLWVGHGQPFSRSEFENLRAEMISRGLARWKNEEAPHQGVELTAAGRAVLRFLASDAFPPPHRVTGERVYLPATRAHTHTRAEGE